MTTQPRNPTFFPDKKDFFLKSWIWLLGLSVLGFSPFIFNFIWGNHDWQWVKEYTPLTSGFFEGRFSQFVLQNLLYQGQILPILTLLTALIFFSLAAILLFRLWNIPKQSFLYILLGLNLVCNPYTLSWLYFSFITLSNLSWVFIVVISYTLLNKYPQSFLRLFTSTLLLTLALGGYPPIINLISLILCTLILNDLCIRKLTTYSILKKYLPHILVLLSTLLCFLALQYLLKKFHLQYSTYNTSEIALSDIFPKLIFSFQEGIKQFFSTTTFIEYRYKYLNLCLFLLAAILLFQNMPKTPQYLIAYIIMLFGIIFSSVLTLFAANNTEYVINAPRIDFFGLLFIYIYSASILLKSNNLLLKNLTLFTLCYLCFYNFNQIAYAQKIWQAGFKAETNLSERIIQRIENSPTFNSHQKYTFVQSGTLDFRSRFYHETSSQNTDGYMLSAPYIPWHLPSKAYKFYYPEDFFATDFDIFWQFIEKEKLHLTPNLVRYLDNTSDVWPNKNSVFINKRTIILTLSPDGKNRAHYWIKNNL